MAQLTSLGPDVWAEPDDGAAQLVEAALAETPGAGVDGGQEPERGPGPGQRGYDPDDPYWRLLGCGCPAGVVADEGHQEGGECASRWTRPRVLRVVADLVEAGLPAPMTVMLFEHSEHSASPGTVALRLDNEATGDVDAWAGRLDMPPAVLGDRIDGGRPFRPYKAEQDSRWPWWRVELWCAVHDQPAGESGGA